MKLKTWEISPMETSIAKNNSSSGFLTGHFLLSGLLPALLLVLLCQLIGGFYKAHIQSVESFYLVRAHLYKNQQQFCGLSYIQSEVQCSRFQVNAKTNGWIYGKIQKIWNLSETPSWNF